jgi:3-methylcrotonyl-CoA carboxylase alpha subunit
LNTFKRTFRGADGELSEVTGTLHDGRLAVQVGERTLHARVLWRVPGSALLELESGERARVHYAQNGDQRWATALGQTRELVVVRGKTRSGAGAEEGAVVSPMPGRVVSVEVSVGMPVSKGQVLVRVEAMKMEHALKAAHAGVVEQVAVEVGAQVLAGALLVSVSPKREEGE